MVIKITRCFYLKQKLEIGRRIIDHTERKKINKKITKSLNI